MSVVFRASRGERCWRSARCWAASAAAGACSLSLSVGAASAARHRLERARPGGVIQAYGAITGFAQGDIRSPDLHYIARARLDEGSVLIVTVVDARSGRALARMPSASGFIWVPSRQHRLAIAACGIYYSGFLGYWDGGHAWHSLHQVRRPSDECFRLHGVSADGRYVVYGYDPNINASETPREWLLGRRIWLRLPDRKQGQPRPPTRAARRRPVSGMSERGE